MLVQICGLPGTGKSTLAAALAERGPVVLLRIDAIEAAMRRNGLTPSQTGIACYSVAHAIALPHLQRGLTVIADAVSAVAAARDGWRGTADAAGVPLRVIETVLPDPVEHRRRVEGRTNDLAGFTLPSWVDVQAVAEEYEPRLDDRLVLDTRRELSGCLQEALNFLSPPGESRHQPG
jgi:predicted kinase